MVEQDAVSLKVLGLISHLGMINWPMVTKNREPFHLVPRTKFVPRLSQNALRIIDEIPPVSEWLKSAQSIPTSYN